MKQEGLFDNQKSQQLPGRGSAGTSGVQPGPKPGPSLGPSPAPLAFRMRPRTLDEFVGQRHLLGDGGPIRRLIDSGHITSMIFYGPPGTGKTALAELISTHTQAVFQRLNAVTAGVSDLRKVIEQARQRQALGKPTVLFIDEIHRFNKAQQDALLPAVEQGIIVLIGATTENPYFSVNSPLISRSRVFQFEPLSEDDLITLLRRALSDNDRGLGKLNLKVEDDVLRYIARMAGGDARAALNALELVSLHVAQEPTGDNGTKELTLSIAQQALQRPVLHYDADGDNHYDMISAFIKSMRGSDPDATVYWLARMLDSGEDPRFIARRIVIHASEDVGLADPQALVVAVAAAQAVELVGLPEARLNLAQAALYVALAPKSNRVYKAINAATRQVKQGGTLPVPLHLRDRSYPGARHLGHGEGYLYPHDFPGHYVVQNYLPDGLVGTRFYEPSQQGFERQLAERLRRWRSEKGSE